MIMHVFTSRLVKIVDTLEKGVTFCFFVPSYVEVGPVVLEKRI